MATTTNFGWETPDDTDLVKDGALAIRTLGSAIDTSMVDLKGGTTGQVLSKTSNTDMDFTWVTTDDANAIQNAIVDAKGDLITATAADTPARLAVGNNGETLVADSSTATGLKWQADTVNTVIDAKGDLLVGTAADTLSRLAVGANDTVLTADSSTATGLKWAAAASGPTFAGCSLWKSASQSSSNATWTNVTFDSEHFDTDAYHSTSSNTSRITIPSGKAGKYQINAMVMWPANGTGSRLIKVQKNGSDIMYGNWLGNAGSSDPSAVQLSGILDLAVADYIELNAYQASGGSLNIDFSSTKTFFQVTYLGA